MKLYFGAPPPSAPTLAALLQAEVGRQGHRTEAGTNPPILPSPAALKQQQLQDTSSQPVGRWHQLCLTLQSDKLPWQDREHFLPPEPSTGLGLGPPGWGAAQGGTRAESGACLLCAPEGTRQGGLGLANGAEPVAEKGKEVQGRSGKLRVHQEAAEPAQPTPPPPSVYLSPHCTTPGSQGSGGELRLLPCMVELGVHKGMPRGWGSG